MFLLAEIKIKIGQARSRNRIKIMSVMTIGIPSLRENKHAF